MSEADDMFSKFVMSLDQKFDDRSERKNAQLMCPASRPAMEPSTPSPAALPFALLPHQSSHTRTDHTGGGGKRAKRCPTPASAPFAPDSCWGRLACSPNMWAASAPGRAGPLRVSATGAQDASAQVVAPVCISAQLVLAPGAVQLHYSGTVLQKEQVAYLKQTQRNSQSLWSTPF